MQNMQKGRIFLCFFGDKLFKVNFVTTIILEVKRTIVSYHLQMMNNYCSPVYTQVLSGHLSLIMHFRLFSIWLVCSSVNGCLSVLSHSNSIVDLSKM